MNDREVRTTRIIAAPCERVFAAWTDPAQLASWWGP
ncbi:MAG TPA: SRPBCC domain-containing protein [Flavobacteriales bacterium]|nr:SRPBCC domain-containing protein [Flavobacteriales bacterium]